MKTCTKCTTNLTRENTYFDGATICKKCHSGAVSERQKVRRVIDRENFLGQNRIRHKQWMASASGQKFRAKKKFYTQINKMLKDVLRELGAADRAQRNKIRQRRNNQMFHAANRDRLKEYTREWRRRHPEFGAANRMRRAARKQGNGVGDMEAIRSIYRRARSEPVIVCYLCKKTIPPGERHVDHVTPLSRGGSHSADNLAIVHGTCNISKGSLLPCELQLPGVFVGEVAAA